MLLEDTPVVGCRTLFSSYYDERTVPIAMICLSLNDNNIITTDKNVKLVL